MKQRSKVRLSDSAASASRSVPPANPFPAGARPHIRWLSCGICILLALAVWAVFGQTLHHKFVNFDDAIYVFQNPAITPGLSFKAFVWAFTHSVCANWHPLTVLSHMLDCQLYGLNPAGHHLTNVILHCAVAILLFIVLQDMTGALWRSAFAAALFAIHPQRVESVAWVAERKDLLSGMFFLLAIWAYARYVRSKVLSLRPRSSIFYLLAILFFAFALMSKPMAVTLPFVLLLLDYWPLGRVQSPNSKVHATEGRGGQSPSIPISLLIEKLPFFALSALGCLAAVLAQRATIEAGQVVDFPARLGNALVAYAAYLGQMVYPVGLAVFYPHPGNHLLLWKVAVSLLVLLLISFGVAAGRRKRPWLVVGWLWYLGMLVPVLGLVQVGSQARADRYTYLPEIGVNIIVSWGATELCGAGRLRRAGLVSAAAVVLGSLLLIARARTEDWKDSVSLWTRCMACTSHNYLAHNNLGSSLLDQEKYVEAGLHFEQALEIRPNYAEAHNNLGNVLAAEGKLKEAIQHYRRALELKPDYAEAQLNWGIALADQGELTQAIEHYETALQLDSGLAKAHNNLGSALARQGQIAAAVGHFEQAIVLKPDYAKAQFNWGSALVIQGKTAEAIPHFQQALSLAISQESPSLAETIRKRLKACQATLPRP